MRHVRSMVSEAAKIANMGDYDPLLWAKKPKSQKALDYVIDGAKKSGQLRAILANLVESGITNEAGKLLKRYAGQGKWVTP